MATSVPISSVDSSGNVDPGYSIYLVDASISNVTLTLPDITTDGDWFLFRRIDNSSNTFTLQGYTSGQTIDGSTTLVFSIGMESAVVAYNGVWWRV